MNLLDETYRLLGEAREHMTLRQIADESGVNFHWLGKFAQRAYPEPSVVKVQKLHATLQTRNRPDPQRSAA